MKLILLVGPPGSGKSTLAKTLPGVYVNQDKQGKEGHFEEFEMALENRLDIVVDRMNFNKQQRAKYIPLAKALGYTVEVKILCVPQIECLRRVLARKDHETITNEGQARSALQTFFTKYETPTEDEGIDSIERTYPPGYKPKVIVCDLDGTLCNIEHRIHFVRPPEDFYIKTLGELEPVELDTPLPIFKKNWKAFFDGIPNDTINKWCSDIIVLFAEAEIETVFCSGRDDNQRKMTQDWLNIHGLGHQELYMRNRHDSRQDSIIKEIILDFEILTRYTPYFMIDDRDQVVAMWRRRGFTCLQCANGNF